MWKWLKKFFSDLISNGYEPAPPPPPKKKVRIPSKTALMKMSKLRLDHQGEQEGIKLDRRKSKREMVEDLMAFRKVQRG